MLDFETKLRRCLEEVDEGPTTPSSTASTRRQVGRAKDVGQDAHRILLAGVSVQGTGRHVSRETTQARRSGINRLDKISKRHGIDYSKGKTLEDKWKADDKMIRAIGHLPGKKTWTESIVKKIMQAKRKLKL